MSRTYVSLDLETTGLDPESDAIIEIGAVKFTREGVGDRFSTFVNPQRPIPERVQQLTGISQSDVQDAPPLEAVAAAYDAYAGKRKGFDDPEDLMRLLRGAGVLEFRIAVRAKSPEGVNPTGLREQLAE